MQSQASTEFKCNNEIQTFRCIFTQNKMIDLTGLDLSIQTLNIPGPSFYEHSFKYSANASPI